MGLFAQESDSLDGAQKRYQGVTKERGTRNIILWFIAVVAAWMVVGKIQDYYLLQARWPLLKSVPEGLTVVGTLDSKDYDHNLFRVVTANQTSRVELTEYGWNTIFDEKNGPMFREQIGDIIRSVQGVDSETCYRMLEPYLRAGIQRAMGRVDWPAMVTRETPITVMVTSGKVTEPKATTLGELLDKYSTQKESHNTPEDNSVPEGGSGSGRQVDHGMVIPTESLLATTPVVLTGSSFTSADIDENPANVFDGKSYTVRLYLKPEGRSRFYQWSSAHENENLVFILKHRVAVAGRIKQKMDVTYWEIGPLHDQEMAKSLVDYINANAKSSN